MKFTDDLSVCESDDCIIEIMENSDSLDIGYLINTEPDSGMVWILTTPQGATNYMVSNVGDLTISSTEQLFLTKTSVLSVDDEISFPKAFTLHQNYPNPFNPETSIQFDLPNESEVRLVVFDLRGREVTQLVNTIKGAGYRSVQWDGTDLMGRPVSAGVYLYQIQAGEFVQTRKMVLLK